MGMNIYLVSRTDEVDYDEYDAVVVVAHNAKEAKTIKPSDYGKEWETPENLQVLLVGTANRKRKGIILASFKAG
ncbi:hypothetical protein LCGC14_2064310 [marine sediment metagenome]|uniref:Uncharacterized protein n=1 Tax=marine sediment metagenome TaxID=412755 RepID=A0A0F9EKE1_9ZZZZ